MKSMWYKLLIVLLGISMLVLAVACQSHSIAAIKHEIYIGKEVAVKGTVERTIKLGSLSGYTLKDDAGDTIGVSSERLPAEGDTLTVRGVLIKDSLLGYYIKVQE